MNQEELRWKAVQRLLKERLEILQELKAAKTAKEVRAARAKLRKNFKDLGSNSELVLNFSE